MRRVAALIALLSLPGCVSTVASIVTAPVKVVSKAADLATTSQSESDENRGRAARHRDERIGKLERDRGKAQRKCNGGDQDACERVEDLDQAIEGEMRRPL